MLIQEKIAAILKINLPETSSEPSSTEDLNFDFRDVFTPRNFMQFEMRGKYIQVFSERTGFIPNLSILDVLCNLGPGTVNYLKREI